MDEVGESFDSVVRLVWQDNVFVPIAFKVSNQFQESVQIHGLGDVSVDVVQFAANPIFFVM